ncbi:DUF58 domain-containing protein [Luteimonas kalidii]|uniref:DUF58 domain-containing protein n=1 Tax=Luteimonas kalidii TaxID=3042025 RepID=A0ABT6JPF1_9GAMM|nr:DUF58 domain-containing protein [Luteimonas kalidii]MDH5832564.1 DUF58 domain-containing protein [Luteimonas kalidii]
MAWDPVTPALRAQLRGLRIASRRTSPLRGGGQHRSRDKGAGLEFSQYRSYEPGDEPRRIDWKLYARSDRFFVREAERDSPLAVWLVIDASASMAQADEARPDWSRLDAARTLAACIAEVALRQGDRVGLMGLRDDALALVPAAGGSRQRERLLFGLQRLQAQGGVPDEARLRPAWERIGTDELVVVLGDFLDPASVSLATRLASARREVLAIQVLTVGERDFDFEGGRRFRDPETGEELPADPRALRTEFLARFGQAQRALASRLAEAGIRHARFVLDESPLQPLRALFADPPGASGA